MITVPFEIFDSNYVLYGKTEYDFEVGRFEGTWTGLCLTYDGMLLVILHPEVK